MKYILLLYLISVNAKLEIFISDTPLLEIGQRLYKQEAITNLYKSPNELAYDSSSRNLYFSYMDEKVKNTRRAYFNTLTKASMKIEGVAKNKATAVDSDTGEVYFGSFNGLYKYDPLINIAFKIGLFNLNILKLVIRNNEMFIIDASDHKIYKIYMLGLTVVKVGDWENVLEFEVDNARNIHFVTTSGLYCAINGHETVKNKALFLVYHFLISGEKTYGVTEDCIYEIDCWNGTAYKVANLGFFPRSVVSGDYDDIFYTVDDNIYRLRPVRSYLGLNMLIRNKNGTRI